MTLDLQTPALESAINEPQPSPESPQRQVVTVKKRSPTAKAVQETTSSITPEHPAAVFATQEMSSPLVVAAPSVPSSAGEIQMTEIATSGTAGAAAGKASGMGVNSESIIEQGRTRYLREHFMYIRDRIMGNIKYPEKARHMNWEGVVLISFMVTAEGGVESILIVSSSGFPLLDRNTIDALQQSAPFPKPPVPAKIGLPVTYKLR
jgi:protein TonB